MSLELLDAAQLVAGAGRHVPENRTQVTPAPSESRSKCAEPPKRHETRAPARSNAAQPRIQRVRTRIQCVLTRIQCVLTRPPRLTAWYGRCRSDGSLLSRPRHSRPAQRGNRGKII